MESYRVTVVDSPLPADLQAGEADLNFQTKPELLSVLHELQKREPLFHRSECGLQRSDFERMTAPHFWEVGASGRRYSRNFVLDTLEERYKSPVQDTWELSDFHCREIAADNYLVTYTLAQGERITRRSTIWRRTPEGWQIIYHQGTLVEK